MEVPVHAKVDISSGFATNSLAVEAGTVSLAYDC